MQCKKCGAQIPDGSRFCCACGKPQTPVTRRKKRGNGQGYVFKAANGTWRARVTLGYIMQPDGSVHRKTRTKCGFATKKEALAALPGLKKAQEKRRDLTFRELYDAWLPTHKADDSTLGCYRAAIKYFTPIWMMKMSDVDIDDLQDCIDECPRGKRTKENMRAACGLMYKYGIPRRLIPENMNLAQFLTVKGEAAAHRPSFTDIEIEKIRQAVGVVPYADYVYCMVYLGFRPSEFLALDVQNYNRAQHCLVGGAKTAAGKGRTVTVSPKIQRLVDRAAGDRSSGALFCDESGNAWTLRAFTDRAFYPALEAAGIDNPIVEVAGGVKRHKYTPHSCRHTFATLAKRIKAPEKDMLELIGHTDISMTRYYQDVDLDDLRRITDAI